MTYTPGAKNQGEWKRLCELFPREEGELPGQWMARLLAVADGQPAPVEPARLPYRPDADDAPESGQ